MNIEKRLESNKEEILSVLREMTRLVKDDHFETAEKRVESLSMRLEMVNILTVLSRGEKK